LTARLHIRAAGMVTAVGLDCASSCAAMRARLDGFAETRFLGPDGSWLIGAPIPLPRNWIGQMRMAHLAAGALSDIERQHPGTIAGTPILLCLAEEDRPGRPIPDPAAFARLVTEILSLPASPRLQIIAHGRPSGFIALDRARRLLAAGEDPVIILGVDSYLTAQSIAHYLAENRILAPGNANGFIPGEAAAAILCTQSPGPLRLAGLGLAREVAHIYNTDGEDSLPLPLRAEGMARAHEIALIQAGCRHSDLVLKMGDLIGEVYWFKQMALAMLRLQRERSEVQPIWSIAASLGNIGAAAVPVLLGWAMSAAARGYALPGPIILEASGDDGACGAAVVHRT
jgi:3-oxoacyl-[acyl-carrier-protein] synthase I